MNLQHQLGFPLLVFQRISEPDIMCRLQPVKETREKQVELWTELILRYCRQQKVSPTSASVSLASNCRAPPCFIILIGRVCKLCICCRRTSLVQTQLTTILSSTTGKLSVSLYRFHSITWIAALLKGCSEALHRD